MNTELLCFILYESNVGMVLNLIHQLLTYDIFFSEIWYACILIIMFLTLREELFW